MKYVRCEVCFDGQQIYVYSELCGSDGLSTIWEGKWIESNLAEIKKTLSKITEQIDEYVLYIKLPYESRLYPYAYDRMLIPTSKIARQTYKVFNNLPKCRLLKISYQVGFKYYKYGPISEPAPPAFKTLHTVKYMLQSLQLFIADKRSRKEIYWKR